MFLEKLGELASRFLDNAKTVGEIGIIVLALKADASGQEPKVINTGGQPRPESGVTSESVRNNRKFLEAFRIREDSARWVDVGGRKYKAYPLSNSMSEPSPVNPDPSEFFIENPWLVTDGKDVVWDRGLYARAAFAAHYANLSGNGTAARLRKEAGMYRSILRGTKGAELLLEATKTLTELEAGMLLPAAEGKLKAAWKLGKKDISIAQDVFMKAFTKGIKQAVAGKRIVDTSTFKEVMYGILSDSASELDSAARELETFRETRDFAKARKISERIISAKTRAYAAAKALAFYYGGGPFNGYMNFMVEQVGKPIVKGMLNAEIGDDRLGKHASGIIDGLVQTHSDAHREYLSWVELARRRYQADFGMRCVDAASGYVLKALMRICRKGFWEIPKEDIRLTTENGSVTLSIRGRKATFDAGALYRAGSGAEGVRMEAYDALVGNVDGHPGKEYVVALNFHDRKGGTKSRILVLEDGKGGALKTKAQLGMLSGGFTDGFIKFWDTDAQYPIELVDIDGDGIHEIRALTAMEKPGPNRGGQIRLAAMLYKWSPDAAEFARKYPQHSAPSDAFRGGGFDMTSWRPGKAGSHSKAISKLMDLNRDGVPELVGISPYQTGRGVDDREMHVDEWRKGGRDALGSFRRIRAYNARVSNRLGLKRYQRQKR
jgi:hypothetical protein